MAQHSELLFLVHNVSSISVDCNGKRPASPELRSRSLDLCKASVKSGVLITTNMNRGDSAKNPKKAHSPKDPPPQEPVRPLPTRRGNKMKQHVRVKSKKDIRKFKHDAFVLNCNQSLCPALAERMRRHRCADARHRADNESLVKQEIGINVSPTLTQPPASSTDAKIVQTEITLNDFILQNQMADTLAYVNEGAFKITDPKESTKKYIYKRLLYKEITNWLQIVPIFYSTDFTSKYLKENIVTIFVERISRLHALQAFNDNYSTKVKCEIDNCLNVLPMWLPNNKQNQALFKNRLRDKLYDRISELNDTFLKNDGKEYDVTKNVISSESQGTELVIRDSLYAKVVTNWLASIKLNSTTSKKQIVNFILDRVRPLLNTFIQAKSSKRTLKRKMVEVLDDLSISAFNNENLSVQINRLAEELVNRLLTIQSKIDSYPKLPLENITTPIIYNNKLKVIVHDAVVKALGKVNLNRIRDIENEVYNVILNYLQILDSGIRNNISTEICNVLCKKSSISEEKAMQVAKKLKLQIRIALKCCKTFAKASGHSIKSQRSDVTTIYRSSESGPVTSTPKKPNKKNIPKLNKDERSYMKNVAKLIEAWMETLPKKFDSDKQYKDVIINDLAGDIMDEVKREQMSPEIETEKHKHINYMIYRWLSKFEVFDDLHDGIPLIEDFLEKLKEIPEPQLTAPQHGTRQTMGNLRHYEKEIGWEEEYIPKGIDILEDQISVWLNEQSSTLCHDEYQRDEMIKDLAVKLQEHKKNKSPEDIISKDIRQWLKKVVKSEEKEHIDLLTQYLKERVINVPQDETLDAINQKRLMQKAERRQNASLAISQTEDKEMDVLDPEQTMKEYILKYMERNYDIDDPLAKGAFGQLLKTEIRKLSPTVKNKIYNDLTNNEHFRPENFKNELDYIRMISDWLKNIPVNPLYNTPGNRPRVDFVLDLAKNIQEVEELRKQSSEGMDYDLFLSSIISISLRTYNVPILLEHRDDIPLMINQLLSKIIANRSVIRQDDSIANSKITEQHFSEFIEQYIKVNGKEIANDEMKLEAWTARFVKEIRKLLAEVDNPSALTKAQIYDRFSKVPVPGQDSVERFALEKKYIDDITDWLKNLPLLPITGTPVADKQRADMISELAQNISEREAKKSSVATDNTAEKDLIEYITSWISKLPLNPNKNIVVPVAIQQLMNRIERTIKKETEDQVLKTMNIEETGVMLQNKPEKDCKEIIIPETHIIKSDGIASKSPETHIVESIEDWCNKLPIEGVDKDVVNNLRNNIAKQLYQKIGELNVSPRIYNDDVLYENLLGDEIDTQLENLPQNSMLQNNSKKFKDELLSTILAMKKIIHQKAAGDTYKHKLETTIDAAIPNPVQDRQLFEPEFEIYKKHLASMFILDNFDHTDDDIKIKYEKRIRDEIDKYFESAQKRNALPVTRAQMYNDLYSELFKVPMPNEESVIDEVEEVKTRCEIDAWFENLPLREANGVGEYVEWDQILSMLAKRLHHIEKTESDPDEKIYKEISKWLRRLPLLPEEEVNTDYYTDNLQNALKISAEARKYVPAGSQQQNLTKEKSIGKQKSNNGLHTSQVAGPSWSGYKPRSKTREQMTSTPHKRPGALIVDIVENWCDEIPLIGDEVQNKLLKSDLSTKIVIKICELNMDPNIFNDDLVYDQLLDEELDKQISKLSMDQDFPINKSERKHALIEMIKSIKELIRDENQKHEYKTELHNTVSSILKDHSDTPDKKTEFNKLKDKIVDDFIQFYYNKDDDEAKLVYKRNLYNAISTYLSKIEDSGDHLDPLVKLNQLICEMSKVPAPKNKVLKNEIEEIKMKQEIEHFFDKYSLNDDTDKTQQTKRTLAKILNEIEKSGHNDNNDQLMKVETAKCLNKYNTEVDPDAIKKFVNALKNNESKRKAPPKSKDDEAFNISAIQRPADTWLPPKTGPLYTENQQQNAGFNAQTEPQHPQNVPISIMDQSRCQCGQQRMPSNRASRPFSPPEFEQASPKAFQSCPPFDQNQHILGTSRPTPSVTPQLSSSYCPRNTRRGSEFVFPPSDFDPSQGPLNYDEFKSKTFLNSTVVPQDVNSGDINGIAPMESYRGSVKPYSSSIGSNKSSSFSRMATPRRVQGEAPTRESLDLTADQLFQAPIFVPRPKSSHLTVLSGNPSGSSRCFRPSRVPSGRSSNRYWPAVAQKEKYPCICDKKLRMKGRPFYIVPVDEFCDDCGGFSSTWYKMCMPACYYMQY